MEERIKQLEKRVKELEEPSFLNARLKNLLITNGFVFFNKELRMSSAGANIEYIQLFLKAKNNDYVISATPEYYYKEFIADISDDTIISKNHGLEDDKQIILFTNGVLPAPLQLDTSYWVLNPTSDTFNLSTDGVNPINITSSGIGIHFWQYFT